MDDRNGSRKGRSSSSSTAGWLDRLADHAIFTLPPDAEHPAPLSTHPSLAELARPPSPNLSFSISSSTRGSHSRRAPQPERSQPGRRQSRVALVRGVDLIVAVGSEIRIASLVDSKAKSEDESGSPLQGAQPGEYKTLSTPCIAFEIQQLVLNPTSKLLAVVGLHSVAVVVLPRKGWSTSVGRTLECRSLLVGKFYHALPASPAVAQIAWHPWGEHSSSLLVLSSDAMLREYAIGDDAEEPVQTVSFAPGGPDSSRDASVFSSDDAAARKAVAFAVGEGSGDWGPLTVYCLMQSGDIYALCPFLPKKATMPSSYIHALSCFVSAKVDYLATTSQNSSLALTSFNPSASASLALSTFSTRTASTPPLTSLEALYTLQLKYATSLVHQATTSHQSLLPDAMDVDPSEFDRPVRVVAPRAPHPRRQGPFLLQPAPEDLENGMESNACDLCHFAYAKEGQATVGVFAIAYTDGKVDVCLEVEKVEARWGESPSPSRYGDEDRDEEEEELPVLSVYETIDLGLAQARDQRPATACAPTFVRDPLYPDTLYVYHSLGAHCILFAPWIDRLASALSEDTEEDDEALQREVERALRASEEGSEVLWILKTASVDPEDQSECPVVGLAIVNDVYLGYSALLVTAALQLVGIELALRVDPSLTPSLESADLSRRGVPSDPPAYLSLLDAPFTIPPFLERRSGVPRLALKPPSGSAKANGGKPELVVTAETLRFLGKTVEAFRTEIRDLVESANAVQNRLELQMKELTRQVSKLAELSKLSDTLRRSTSSSEGLAGRMERITATQTRLLWRVDRVLQRLMDTHEPVLSTYEKRWFEELGRLEKEVTGGAGGDASLERRAERVVAQIESLRPVLEELKAKETRPRDTIALSGVKTNGSIDSPGGLGTSQMKQLEGKLAEEAKLIAEAREKLERLTAALANASLT